jgi:hypothetical protein
LAISQQHTTISCRAFWGDYTARSKYFVACYAHEDTDFTDWTRILEKDLKPKSKQKV